MRTFLTYIIFLCTFSYALASTIGESSSYLKDLITESDERYASFKMEFDLISEQEGDGGSTIIGENSPYLKDRITESDKRYASFKMALDLISEREAKVLVETGTARYGDQEFGGDGGSTIIFGDWASKHDATLYSIDHSEAAIEKAQRVTQQFSPHIRFSRSDTIAFLEKFDQPIDFLYLDSQEYDCNQPLPSQEHHLREIVTAYPSLHEKSVVMIDDCELPNGGQGKFAIEFLIDRNWEIIHQGYQTILIKCK